VLPVKGKALAAVPLSARVATGVELNKIKKEMFLVNSADGE
jgi:hypothetical protein